MNGMDGQYEESVRFRCKRKEKDVRIIKINVDQCDQMSGRG